ncbi:MAG: DNA helicase RecQ [Desulfobacterales bacterium]|jgi:ATP-dependent DNA helicase RecQ|nr:DNA helicase RecQ [Desulfobacterales bacterium]
MPDIMIKAHSVLQKIFGFKDFVSLQAQIIAHVMAGNNALVIMPTGGGKSLCYQIPALLFDGLTIVVSPLISLMTDQIQQMRENGVAAVMLNSALEPGTYRANMAKVKSGTAKLLYVAPETLLKDSLLELLGSIRVDCLAIDEAHCISEWGHDFRPEYRRLTAVREQLPKAVCMALTATATEQVRRDIKNCLGLGENTEFVSGFDRPNLFLEVAFKDNPYRQVLNMIRRHPDQPGIIYCATRKQVDRLALLLTQDGIPALPYHAGLSDVERKGHQERFSKDDVQVMVATIAFGMGIDKSNIRFVIHYDLPKNMESYYQEIGRAGRDGMKARCLLLYSYGDIHKIKFMIGRMNTSRQRTANLLLTTLLRYVETDVCRRRVMLDYFGERYGQETCGMCDNCLATKSAPEDLSVAAQKLLSCVKRTNESFGVEHIIDVLRGSKAQKVLRRGHHRLSTYAIGLEYSRNQWRHLARQLLHKGFMSQDMEYGGLHLTPKAWALFRDQTSFRGFLPAETSIPEEAKKKTSTEAERIPHDPLLFELLRKKRKRLADEAQIPPFVIFSDRTLTEMAARMPRSKESLLQIHGVGQVKERRYGPVFLDIIRRYCDENSISEDRPPAN